MSRSSRPRNLHSTPTSGKVGNGSAVASRPVATPTLAPPRVDHSSTSRSPAPRQSVSLPISHDQIAAAAYKLWQARGGSAEQNWLEAETRLRRQAEVGT